MEVFFLDHITVQVDITGQLSCDDSRTLALKAWSVPISS